MKWALVAGLTLAIAATGVAVTVLARQDRPAPPEIASLGAVGIRTSGCGLADELGGGVRVAPGRILTSAHGVAGATAITVIDGDQDYRALVDVFDPEKDLAVLAAAVDGPQRPVGSASSGTAVWIATWTPTKGIELAAAEVSRRILVTIEDIYVDGEYQREAIELSTGLPRGASGSGVFTADGALVGVVYATSRERNASFALAEPELTAILQESDSEPDPNGRCP